MDLKSFVSETLTQIVEGIAEAQEKIAAGGSNAAVNPKFVSSDARHKHGPESAVEFDVALVAATEASDSSSAKVAASAGILAVVTAKISAGGETQTAGAQRNESVSRVKFTVQLAQPGMLKETNDRPVSIPRTKTAWTV